MSYEDTDSEAGESPSDADTVTYQWDESVQPSTALVEAVAAATGREPTDLPPLQETLDGDALDVLLTGASGPLHLSFSYVNVSITIASDGRIEVVTDDDEGVS